MLAELRESICRYVKDLDASALTGTEALLGLRHMAAIENAAATAKALFAARLADTEIHRGRGHKSAADLIAGETGTTIGAVGARYRWWWCRTTPIPVWPTDGRPAWRAPQRSPSNRPRCRGRW